MLQRVSFGLVNLLLGTACFILPSPSYAQQPYELLKIPADPGKGFHWPYYLSIPPVLVRPAVLLVEPNNSGATSDDQSFHDPGADHNHGQVFRSCDTKARFSNPGSDVSKA